MRRTSWDLLNSVGQLRRMRRRQNHLRLPLGMGVGEAEGEGEDEADPRALFCLRLFSF